MKPWVVKDPTFLVKKDVDRRAAVSFHLLVRISIRTSYLESMGTFHLYSIPVQVIFVDMMVVEEWYHRCFQWWWSRRISCVPNLYSMILADAIYCYNIAFFRPCDWMDGAIYAGFWVLSVGWLVSRWLCGEEQLAYILGLMVRFVWRETARMTTHWREL